MTDYEKKQMLDAFLKNYQEIKKEFVKAYDEDNPEKLAEDLTEFITLFDVTTKQIENLQIYDVIFGMVDENQWLFHQVEEEFTDALLKQLQLYQQSSQSNELQLAKTYQHLFKYHQKKNVKMVIQSSSSELTQQKTRSGRSIKKPTRFKAGRDKQSAF